MTDEEIAREHFDKHKAQMRYTACTNCGKPFSDENVHTLDGWRETQISGECEDCFDALFSEDERD